MAVAVVVIVFRFEDVGLVVVGEGCMVEHRLVGVLFGYKGEVSAGGAGGQGTRGGRSGKRKKRRREWGEGWNGGWCKVEVKLSAAGLCMSKSSGDELYSRPRAESTSKKLL